DGGKPVATVPLNDPVGVLGVVSDNSPNGFGVVSIGNMKVFGHAYATDYISSPAVYATSFGLNPSVPNNGLGPCDGSTEGQMLLTFGGAGQDSHMNVCRKRAYNSFEWKQVF